MSTPALAALPIRHLTHDDLSTCAELSQNRGWPRDEHKWHLLLTAGTAYGIDDPAGGLAATCVLTSYGPRDAPTLGTIGMMLVAEQHARQGLGRRLLRHVIESAGATPLTLYATSFGRPLYEKLGFATTGQSETVEGRLASRTPGPAAAGCPGEGGTTDPAVPVRRAVASDLQTILRLDHDVLGIDRTHMITRLPAFADDLYVAESGDRIIGYAAAWPGTSAQVIGPLVAENAQTAKALVTAVAAGTDRKLRTDVDTRHTELLTWLKEHGFAVTALNAIMTNSDRPLPGDWTRAFAPLSAATG